MIFLFFPFGLESPENLIAPRRGGPGSGLFLAGTVVSDPCSFKLSSTTLKITNTSDTHQLSLSWRQSII